jgi:hypothetical protein
VYKLFKSEIQDNGIFLNVFETLNLEKLENINISISDLISITKQIGLEQIKLLTEINYSLSEVNQTITQFGQNISNDLKTIKLNLVIGNILSLINIIQRKNNH